MSYPFGHVDRDDRLDLVVDEPPPETRAPARGGLWAALLTGLVMALFAGGLWFAYVLGTHHPTTGQAADNVPLLRADQRPTRIKPDQPGGMDIPDRDKLIYNEQPSAPGVEKLLPPPEKPLPRPGPNQTASAAPPLIPPAASPPVAAATPPSPAPETVPAVKNSLGPAAAAKPAHPAGAAMPAGIRIQLGSMRSEDLARQEWTRLKRLNGDLLGGLTAVAVRADLGDRGIYYRIEAGPLADGAEAGRVCSEMKRRNFGCTIVR